MSLGLYFARRSSQNKYTPLQEAAAHGHAEVAKVLLAAGASVHATDTVSGNRRVGWITKGIPVIQITPPSPSPISKNYACFHIMLAGRRGNMFLSFDQNHLSLSPVMSLGLYFARRSSQNKYTPLHVAAAHGHAEVMKVLLAAGANVHATGNVSGGRGVGWITETGFLT